MASWTTQCWPNVISALETGRPIRFCFEDQEGFQPFTDGGARMVVRQVCTSPSAHIVIFLRFTSPSNAAAPGRAGQGAPPLRPADLL